MRESERRSKIGTRSGHIVSSAHAHIRNYNLTSVIGERSKRRVEALEQLFQGSEQDAECQRKIRCLRTTASSRPVGLSDEHTETEPCFIGELSPTASKTFSSSLTPPFDETYTGFEAICDNFDDGSSTSPLDFGWVMDPSLNLCNISPSTTLSCANNINTIPSGIGIKHTDLEKIPSGSSLQPLQSVTFEGQTALHIAAGSGGLKTVTMLLNMSADVLAKDGSGRTALHIAVEKSQEAVVAELVKHKSLLDQANRHGKTALHLAVAAGNEPIVRLLLGAGSGVDVKDGTGHTALHISAMQDTDLIMKLLLAQGADIDARI
jgi:hypothetical protein